jgi:predicted RecA/RadA family phage recombinase
MKNYICSGERITVTAPSGGLTSGDVYLLGHKICIVLNGADEGEAATLLTKGVVEVTKGTGAITQGTPVYWDVTNKVFTTTAQGNTFAGYAYADAASADTEFEMMLVESPAPTKVAVQAASTATTVAGTVADLNTLIAALKTAGLMATS